MNQVVPDGVVAIINPAAGNGRALRRWQQIERHLLFQGMYVTAMYTARPGHATELSRLVVERGATTVVAVGGDGTVHEVINGFQRETGAHRDVRLGIVPAGTGMDFARGLGMSRGVRAAAERLVRGNERRVDLGLVRGFNPRLFMNFAEVGLGAAVAERQNPLLGGLPGKVNYFLAVVNAGVKEENVVCTVTVDGNQVCQGPVVSVLVANGPYVGGGMKVAPAASMDDGVLDFVILGDFKRIELLSNIWKLYPGTHLRHRKVLSIRGRQATIESRGTARLHLDGELYGSGAHEIAVLPRALRVVL
jgi:diacylglycerol kinase (ATP)